MFLSKLGVVANLALVAHAMLLPPPMTAEELGDDMAMEGLVVNPFRRTITLDCPGCPFARLEGDSYQWTSDVGSTLRLDLEVADEINLNVGNVQLFPPAFSLDTIHLSQIDPASDESLSLRVTSFLFRYHGAETVSERGTELLPMKLEILSVEDMPVRLPELTINILKDTEGRLMIASFDTRRRIEDVFPTHETKECKEWPLLCQWRHVLADRIAKMKKFGQGCRGRPHGHGYQPMREAMVEGEPHDGAPAGRSRHGPHHGHHGHHGHHRHGRLQSLARRAFFTILIPVVIGVFAGTVTYLLGMALGCLMAMAMAKMRGQAYEQIRLEDDEEEGEEGKGSMESKEDSKEAYAELPAYEAPPVYEEAGDEACVDSK